MYGYYFIYSINMIPYDVRVNILPNVKKCAIGF